MTSFITMDILQQLFVCVQMIIFLENTSGMENFQMKILVLT